MIKNIIIIDFSFDQFFAVTICTVLTVVFLFLDDVFIFIFICFCFWFCSYFGFSDSIITDG